MSAVRGAEGFAALHRDGDPLVLPNVWEVAVAAFLVRAGFPAVATTSLGVAASNGLPDGTGAAVEESLRLTRRLATLPCHVSVDLEAGSVPAAVAAAAAGAVGVNVEDGRPGGGLAPVGEQSELVARLKREVPGLFVNARTDTHWLRTGDRAEALTRARAYADAGADGVFVPGLAEPADIAAVVRAVDVPVNVLFLPGRHTVRQLADLGVRRVSVGSLLFRAALQAAVATAEAVRDGGAVPADLPSYVEVNVDVNDPAVRRSPGG